MEEEEGEAATAAATTTPTDAGEDDNSSSKKTYVVVPPRPGSFFPPVVLEAVEPEGPPREPWQLQRYYTTKCGAYNGTVCVCVAIHQKEGFD